MLQACVDFKCRNPCSEACGENANCDVQNHRAVCSCPKDYIGNPYSRCYPECTQHSDCQASRACFAFKCTDPCVNACGVGAECRVQNHKAICSCPKGYTGHPFDRCRPFEKRKWSFDYGQFYDYNNRHGQVAADVGVNVELALNRGRGS